MAKSPVPSLGPELTHADQLLVGTASYVAVEARYAINDEVNLRLIFETARLALRDVNRENPRIAALADAVEMMLNSAHAPDRIQRSTEYARGLKDAKLALAGIYFDRVGRARQMLYPEPEKRQNMPGAAS